MTCISQDALPTLLLGVCETAAAAESGLSAGVAVSVFAAFTAGAAAGSAPCSMAKSISLASSGEATRTVWPSITSSLGGAIAGPGCRVAGTAATLSAKGSRSLSVHRGFICSSVCGTSGGRGTAAETAL